MYDIKNLIALESELKKNMRVHFVDFLSSHDYNKYSRSVVSKSMSTLLDAEKSYYGRGLYVILSDYQLDQNKCSFTLDGLKAVYRGHGYKVKSRLKSHLFNDHYRRNLPEKGVRYDVCMKLDDKNGINIDESPYNKYRWKVVVYKMMNSSKMMREQAELAFDEVYGRPLASKEPG
ncbi:hypothetical protein [Pseudomonas frederiksbergensis]|uniref:Uncharacterized protein n=1 Tax=Pseudomonas frederiksbergensis TaxID=104087 RepID=A0A6L5C0H7_9PSED|nr:hypothetical protein [Pseudomonas frederiksbergensis]KAF2394329.1 hypothetical protein FX983_02310 [Pseudomonas frederiksbergensis]